MNWLKRKIETLIKRPLEDYSTEIIWNAAPYHLPVFPRYNCPTYYVFDKEQLLFSMKSHIETVFYSGGGWDGRDARVYISTADQPDTFYDGKFVAARLKFYDEDHDGCICWVAAWECCGMTFCRNKYWKSHRQGCNGHKPGSYQYSSPVDFDAVPWELSQEEREFSKEHGYISSDIFP